MIEYYVNKQFVSGAECTFVLEDTVRFGTSEARTVHFIVQEG